MNKEQYQSLINMLKANECDIDKAIKITETNDFKRINKEKMDETWESIREIMQGVAKRMTDLFSNLIPEKPIFDFLSKSLTQPSIVDTLNNINQKKENIYSDSPKE
ncbi:MAG: hypothetical protein RSA08_02290 [Clostridia bacterium]